MKRIKRYYLNKKVLPKEIRCRNPGERGEKNIGVVPWNPTISIDSQFRKG